MPRLCTDAPLIDHNAIACLTVLRNEKFDEKADVFSMGVILWEVSNHKRRTLCHS